jgi:uncharacterized protein (DUF1330 family)
MEPIRAVEEDAVAVYVIADIEVTEPGEYEEYKRLAGASVQQYGGRYAVRGGRVERLEGEWSPRRFVMLEFPTIEQARTWYDSPEYREARAIRERTAKSNIVMVEG